MEGGEYSEAGPQNFEYDEVKQMIEQVHAPPHHPTTLLFSRPRLALPSQLHCSR